VLLCQQAKPLLDRYELSRKQYEQQGFSHTATCLIKALSFKSKLTGASLSVSIRTSMYWFANLIAVETVCPAMLEISLTKSISLFATVSFIPLTIINTPFVQS